MKFIELIRPSILSISISFIILFIIALLYANIVNPQLPIQVRSSTAAAWYGKEVVVLEYKRSFLVEDDFIGTVIRTVKCNNGRNYDLPDTTRKFKEGSYKTHRSVMLPYTITVGTKCTMTTSIAWQPTLAFVKYIQDIEEVPFEVGFYENRPKQWLPTNEEG